MIDTIVLKKEFNAIQEAKLSELGKMTKGHDLLTGAEFTYYSFDLPSYSSSINIYSREGEGKITFSAPKQSSLGTNALMLYAHDLEEVTKEVMERVALLLGQWSIDFSYKKLVVKRLDICRNYLAHSQEEALEYVSRMEKLCGREHVYFVRGNYTQKLYLKHTEFRKHDFLSMFKKDPSRALEILELSKGIIRFETELRQKQLQKEFDKKIIYLEDITDSKIDLLLNKYWEKMGLQDFNTDELSEKLVDLYGEKRGKELSFISDLANKPKVVSRREWAYIKKQIKTAIKLVKKTDVTPGKFEPHESGGKNYREV